MNKRYLCNCINLTVRFFSENSDSNSFSSSLAVIILDNTDFGGKGYYILNLYTKLVPWETTFA